MLRAAGSNFSDFARLDCTTEFIDELSADVGIHTHRN